MKDYIILKRAIVSIVFVMLCGYAIAQDFAYGIYSTPVNPIESAVGYEWEIQLDSHGNFWSIESTRNGERNRYHTYIDFPITITNGTYLCKYNADGCLINSYRLAEDLWYQCHGLRIDSQDNIIIYGRFYNTQNFDVVGGSQIATSLGSSDAFVAKYDSQMNYLWHHVFGSNDGNNYESIYELELDSDDDLIFKGRTVGSVDIDQSVGTNIVTNKYYLAKYNVSGGYEWGYALSDSEMATDIATDGNDNFYLISEHDPLNTPSVSLDITGAVSVMSSRRKNNIVKYSSGNSGAPPVYQNYASIASGFALGERIVASPSGEIYSMGRIIANQAAATFNLAGGGSTTLNVPAGGPNNNGDIAVAKLNNNMEWEWAYQIGSNNYDNSRDIAVDDLGNLYLCGIVLNWGTYPSNLNLDMNGTSSTSYATSSSSHMFYAKYDSNQNLVWSGVIGNDSSSGSSFPYPYITPHENGEFFIQGHYDDVVDIDVSATVYNIEANIAPYTPAASFIAKYGTKNTPNLLDDISICGDSPAVIQHDSLNLLYNWFNLSNPTVSLGNTNSINLDPVIDGIYVAHTTCYADTFKLSTVQEYHQTMIDSICSGDLYELGSQSIGEAGVYTETYTSVAGCDSIIELTLLVKDCGVFANFSSSTTAICLGDSISFQDLSTGSNITAWDWSFPGGTPSSYTGQNPPFISYSTPGQYDVTLSVVGTEGNMHDTTFINYVTVPSALNITGDITNLQCYEDSSGAIDITVEGGSGAYSYNWSELSTTEDLAGLEIGTYSVTVTDQNNCITTESFVLTQPEEISVSIIDSICSGVLYELGSQSIGEAGVYTETYTSVDGCDSIVELTLLVKDCGVFANFSSSTTAICLGDSISFQDLSTGSNITAWDWSFPGGTPSSYTGQNPPFISYSTPGQYDVTLSIVGTEGNMHDTTFINYITVPSVLTVIGDITNLQCYEDSSGAIDITVEGGSGAYSYNWSELSTTEDLAGLEIGTYSVTVTDQNNCIETESFVLTQPEEISVSIETTHIMCYGDANGEAHITVSGGTPEYIFSWSNGIQTSTDVYGLDAGHYDITMTDGNNCKVYESIEITQPNQLTVSLPNDFYMCTNPEESIQTSTTGGVLAYTYLWNTGSTDPSIMVSPNETTDYAVTVTDANNCTSIAQITVGVYPPFSFSVSTSDENICQGESVTIEGTFSGGAGEPYFVYHNNEMIALPYTLNPQFTQAFEFESKDICGSIDRQTIEIRVDPLPDFLILSDINYGCQPVEIQFQSISTTTNQVFQDFSWSFFEAEDMTIKNTAFPSYSYESSGLFDVQLKVTNEFGCSKTKLFGEYITVHPKPIVKFSTRPSQASQIDPTIYFDNNSIHAYENYWDFGDGYTSLIMSPEHLYGAYESDYEVMLVVKTEFGCSDSLTSTVKIKPECPFYAPNAFTPDTYSNNHYNNHKFNVFGNCIDPDNFEMLIYDRWGELVFEANKYDNDNPLFYGWDGRIKGGEIGNNGVYTWQVMYVNKGGGFRYTETGKVTLIR